MREATTFSRILEMKLRFEIGRKLLRSSVDRDGFLRRGCTRACLNDDGKIPSERERLTRLFTFRSRNEFVNFSESGWNKIDQLWRRGRWKKKRIKGMRW